MEADGLVVRVPHAGYRIPPQITRDRFEDMLEVRLLLEPAAARRAAERASAEQVAGMRRMLDEMAELVEGDSHLAYGAFGLRDAAFHDLVALSAGNQVVREALARLHTHVHLFRLLYDTQVTYLAMGEHDEVLAAIAARDPMPPRTRCGGTSCCPATGSVGCSTRPRARRICRVGLDACARAGNPCQDRIGSDLIATDQPTRH